MRHGFKMWWARAAVLLLFGASSSDNARPLYPPTFPAEVGAFAIYRVSKNSQRVFRGIAEELESRELTLRAAVVGKEVRKERRKRKKEQTYYWVEFDVGDGGAPRVWQKLLILVHEDDLKSGNVLDGAKEYIFQKGEEAPLHMSIDTSWDRQVLEPFRMLDPDLPLKVQVVGTEAYSADEKAPPAYWVRFQGESSTQPGLTDIKRVHRRVAGRAMVAADLPFNLIRLEYTEETTEDYEKSPYPSKTIVSLTLALMDSGKDAKNWVTSKPPEVKATKK